MQSQLGVVEKYLRGNVSRMEGTAWLAVEAGRGFGLVPSNYR